MTLREKPHYRISASSLAEWLDNQPDTWWSVDGEDRLMSILDFPCPSDEIAPEIRKIGKDVLVSDRNPASQARGEEINPNRLNDLAVLNRKHQREFDMCWAGSDDDWLLLEDSALL